MTAPGPRDLLERERELDSITEAIAAARAGAGSLLMLEGPPGVGKTRLLAESGVLAGEVGFTVLSAVGGELERDFPYGVARQLFEPALIRVSGRDRATLLAGAARFASPAIGLGGDPAVESSNEAEFAVLHGLYWLAANLAVRAPLWIAVDDAHWADPPSLRYLSYLARRITDIRAVLVVAARPAESDARALGALAASPAVRMLRPEPLTEQAVGDLVRARLGEHANEDLCRACYGATAGNPFFVVELLRALEQEGVAPGVDSARRVRALGAGAVSDAVYVRLARLPADAQAIATATAILGAAAPLRHVAALAELDEDRSTAAVDTLTTAAILRPGRPLEFVHPVMREAVDAQLLSGQRARSHARAARILADWGANPHDVAAHLLHAEPTGVAWAVDALRDAATDALLRGAPDAAAAFLERALIEPPTPDARGEVLHELGVAKLRAGRLDAASTEKRDTTAITHLRDALALAGDANTRASAARDLADALLAIEQFPEAVSTLEHAIAEVDETQPPIAVGLEAHLLAAAWLDRSTWTRVSPRLDNVAPPTGNTPGERLLLGMLAIRDLMVGEPAAQIAALAERAVEGGHLVDGLTPQAVNFPGIALICCDHLESAEQAFSDRLTEARRRGEIRAVTAVGCWHAETLRRLGRLSEAEAEAREAIAISIERGWSLAMPATRAVLADTLLDQGDPDAAIQALEVNDPPSDYIGWNWYLHARGRARLAAGQHEAGLEDLTQTGRRALDWTSCAPALFPWRSSSALAYTALGETARARDLAYEELNLARRFGAPRTIAIALRAAASAEDHDRATNLLREAAHVIDGSPATRDVAATLVDLGATLRRSGQRAAAREPLRRGLDAATRCGANGLAAHAHQELLATGARPRHLLLTGASALTASERRVAQMAADKLTNREIAQRLFVSQRTVETHLTHCYEKLGITTRTQLRDALDTR